MTNTKRILITGKDSYIGRSFIEFCNKKHLNFVIYELNTRDDNWKKYDFSSYDTVIHLAGIAHIKETKENEHLYYEVNRDLAVEVANKAKQSGVKHFIFMSTMSVYGLIQGHIDINTPTNPNTAYGKSKLKAEEKISELNNADFIISIIRPPMIYGPRSKGNYTLLSNFAKKTKVFPTLDNKRSMLFVDNLSIFLINLVKNPVRGFFFPQNKGYVSTGDLVQKIADFHNNKLYRTSLFNGLFKNINIDIFQKVFGSLTYSYDLSKTAINRNFVDFDESIRRTESE